MSKLWRHQIEGIEYARGRRDCIFHCGMGTGKSRMAVEVILEAIAGQPGCRVLIGCPRAVMPAWAKQFRLWAPHVRLVVLDKGTAKSKEQVVRAALADTTPLVIVGNYETLWRMPVLETIRWGVLCWDEVHRLKAPSGAASRWASRLGKKNPQAKRLGLSGTLLSHSPLDAYGVYRAVESPECQTFGQSYTVFKARYAIVNPRLPGMVVGWRNREEMAIKIAQTTFHRRSEDVLDLPPILFEDLPFELAPQEARLYREIEDDFCAVCEDGSVTPANAMVSVLRLQQICGGFVKYDEAAAATKICDDIAKPARLAEWLEDLPEDEPVVVFCRFRSDIESVIEVCNRMQRSVSELSGRIDRLAEWQDGKTNVLVTQIQSGGIGVDLTRASYGLFYSLGYSLSEYLQAVARLHRPGQKKITRLYHLIAMLPQTRKTVDGRVYEALSERKEVIDAIVEGYRNREHAVGGAA